MQPIPLPVRKALAKLGADLRDARRRRIPTAIMAGRSAVVRATLRKAEKGDPGVSIGTYASLLFVVGLTEQLADLADARFDATGLAFEEERLPKRIRGGAVRPLRPAKPAKRTR